MYKYKFYLCDPNKNKNCKKGPYCQSKCYHTIYKKYQASLFKRICYKIKKFLYE